MSARDLWSGATLTLAVGLGDLVRARRIELGKSQEQVALTAGLDVKTVRQLERGTGSLETLVRVLDVLGCRVTLAPLGHQSHTDTRD